MNQKTEQSTHIFDWDEWGRSQFMYFLSCGLMGGTLALLGIIYCFPSMQAHLNSANVMKFSTIASTYCLTCLFLGSLGYIVQEKQRKLKRLVFSYSLLSSLFYHLGLLIHILMFGSTTMITGIYFSGSIVFGLILLGHKKTGYTLIFSCLSFLGLFYAYLNHYIPYAYLIEHSTPYDRNPAWGLLVAGHTLLHTFYLLYFAVESTTVWRAREKAITKQSLEDPLTGCYNRRFLIEYTQKHIETLNSPISIMMVDIDFFKQINDKYGHDIGDLAIQYTAKKLSENIRKKDLISRFGGEEFCIVMHNCNQDTAKLIAERCRIQLQYSKITIDDNKSIGLTASFGFITIDPDTMKEQSYTPYELFSLADKALYQAKKTGRNKCVAISATGEIK